MLQTKNQTNKQQFRYHFSNQKIFYLLSKNKEICKRNEKEIEFFL